MIENLKKEQTIQEERHRAALAAIGNEALKVLFGKEAYVDGENQQILESLGHTVLDLGLRFVRYQKGA